MYFQTPFPVPSWKQLSAKSLHHPQGLRSFCSIPDFGHHNYFGQWGAWTNFDQCLSLFDKITSEFCLLLALMSPSIEKAYDMEIIRIYRSSATHWCKFGVHMMSCSRDRAVFPASMWENSFSWDRAVFVGSGHETNVHSTTNMMRVNVLPLQCTEATLPVKARNNYLCTTYSYISW